MSFVFSLTGGIGSGKSTVSKIFAQEGVGIVDADLIAREVVVPGSKGLELIVEEFGDVLREGELDRPKLGSIVFTSKEALGRLNHLLLPFIRDRANEMIEQKGRHHDYVCFDAPILIDIGLQDSFRPVVLVSTTPELQLLRVMGRGHTREEALARIRSQISEDERIEQANYVINNTGSLHYLRLNALTAIRLIEQRNPPKKIQIVLGTPDGVV